MEQLFKEIASQVPGLIVLVYLVLQFFKHLNTVHNTLNEFRQTIKEIHKEGLIVIKENTKVLAEVLEHLKSD